MSEVEIPQGRGAGRVAFLAVAAEVAALVSAGWTYQALYRKFRERLGGIQYRQFSRYVRKYVRPRAISAALADMAEVAPPVTAAPRLLATVETVGRADIDAYGGRSVDLEQLARFHKQKGR